MLKSGSSFSLTSAEMENLIFSKSENRNEYVSFVTRLIVHVNEIGKQKMAQTEKDAPPVVVKTPEISEISEVPEPTELMEIGNNSEITQDNSLIVKIQNDEYDWKSPIFRKNILEKM